MVIFVLVFIMVLFKDIHSGDINGSIIVEDKLRKYVLHLPQSYVYSVDYPLVMVFHGGGSSAEQIRNYTGFNKIADKENFIVLYPEATNKNWADGRKGEKLPEKVDDVGFISVLLDTLIKSYSIDTNRIFSTGISNGGFFSIYLAYRLSNRILAVAPVTANIPEDYVMDFKTEHPVSLLLINGTKDPLVKYEGGEIGFEKDTKRGRSVSTDETVKVWLKNNECQNSLKTEKIDDNPDDGCVAEKFTYYRCKDNSKVVLIKIKNGGHTWPGAKQYLPEIIVGKTCMDFKASEIIWEFFSSLIPRVKDE